MIKEEDIKYHTPNPIPYDWAETAYFNFYIPEKNILGLVYLVHRQGIGATVCDIQIVDRWSTRIDDSAYVNASNHNPVVERAEKFSLPNGLSFEAKSLRDYKISYQSKDVDLELNCTGLMPPFDIHDPDMDPMASADPVEALEKTGFGAAYAAHFDMTIKIVGELRLDNETYPVDCIATMDHSWGPRPEVDLSTLLWINAHFSEDYFVHALFTYHPYAPEGQQHTFRHGYAVINGKVRGLIAGEVRAQRDGFYAKSAQAKFTDIDNVEHAISGVAKNNHPWLPYGNCLSPIAMMHWTCKEFPNGGYGTFLEGFPLNDRLRRS